HQNTLVIIEMKLKKDEWTRVMRYRDPDIIEEMILKAQFGICGGNKD
ncbi:13688_t:CDS:1, partial [Entrophospora sp. SA101]